MRVNRPSFIFAILAVPVVSLGWGAEGHRIIGDIAAHHLAPEAKTAIEGLLGDKTLADISTWADEIKSDSTWDWAKPLHYANVRPGEPTFDMERDCPEVGCVVKAIGDYSKALPDTEQPAGERLTALKFVVHFVGDIHQPLHVSHARDRGGNDIKVEFFDNRTNLHTVWDSLLIRRTGKAWAEYATELRQRITPEMRSRWSKVTEPTAWANESYTLAVDHAYVVPSSGELGQKYFDCSIPIVERRLQAAGVRLAELLNRVLIHP